MTARLLLIPEKRAVIDRAYSRPADHWIPEHGPEPPLKGVTVTP